MEAFFGIAFHVVAEIGYASYDVHMTSFSSSDDKDRLGHMIDMEQAVRVTRGGRIVAVAQGEIQSMAEPARGKAKPAVERLHADSAKRWARVYAALAR